MKKRVVEWSDRKHRERHVLLHKQLDELVADFIFHSGKLPSKTSILELMDWSHKQTLSGAVRSEEHKEKK